jgi:hypothetical protein
MYSKHGTEDVNTCRASISPELGPRRCLCVICCRRPAPPAAATWQCSGAQIPVTNALSSIFMSTSATASGFQDARRRMRSACS